jgi:hypothetical protein
METWDKDYKQPERQLKCWKCKQVVDAELKWNSGDLCWICPICRRILIEEYKNE